MLSAVIGLGSPAMAKTAPAADTPADTASASTDDIVVTARKRDERALDVPISLQSFSADEIKASGITDLQVLKDRASFQVPPVLSTAPAGRFRGIIVFRGLQGSAFGDDSRDNSGSLFVDGIYISGGPQSVNTADVERIEVLKGPQNTYFGRGTFGGSVNFITRNPSDKFGGEVNVTATARGSVDGDLSIEGPIVSDVLTARVTAYTHNKVAQYQANDGGDLGAEKTQGISATLLYKPTENFWLRLRGNYQSDDDSAGEIALLSGNTYAAGACAGKNFPGYNERTGLPIPIQSPPRNYFCNGLPSLGTTGIGVITTTTHLPAPFLSMLQSGGIVFSVAPSATNLTPATKQVLYFNQVPRIDHAGMRRDAYRLSAQAGYTFDSGASLGLNVGYNNQASISVYDIDRTDRAENAAPFTAYLNAQAFRSEDYTIDGRFLSSPNKPIRVLFGASYFGGIYELADIQHTYQQNYATAPTVLAMYPNGYETQSGTYQNITTQVPAIYGSIDWDILSNLTVTGEARYQWDKTTTTTTTGLVYSQTFASFLPRATLKFHPGNNLNVYASYSQGVQPAGLNTAYANLTTAQQAYVQSVVPGIGVFSLLPTLKAYELGIKQRLFGGKVNYSLAIYQNDWDNAVSTAAIFNPSSCYTSTPQQQLTATCPLTTAGTAISFPNNARIRGVEFDGSAVIAKGLSVDLMVDYKDAKWVKYSTTAFNSFLFPAGAQPGDRYRGDGNHLARVPAWSGTFTTTYQGRVNDEWGYYIRGDVLYTGKAWDSDLNLFQTDDYARFNLHMGLTRNKNLTIELFSNNLFNDKTWDYAGITVELQGSFADRAVLALPAQKREFGLRTQFKF